MKKIIFAMFVAIFATVNFSSCDFDIPDITLSDVAGATFEGKDSSKSLYVISFSNSTPGAFAFAISDILSDGKYPAIPNNSYTGTYSVSSNIVTLDYSSGSTTETLTGNGAKKLLYATVTIDGKNETMTLSKK